MSVMRWALTILDKTCKKAPKPTFGVLFMTKISKQIKLQAIQDYLSGKYSIPVMRCLLAKLIYYLIRQNMNLG